MLARQCLGTKALEVHDELLAPGQKSALGEEPRADALLDAFYESAVLAADLVVERD
jgi:hypothetical protein